MFLVHKLWALSGWGDGVGGSVGELVGGIVEWVVGDEAVEEVVVVLLLVDVEVEVELELEVDDVLSTGGSVVTAVSSSSWSLQCDISKGSHSWQLASARQVRCSAKVREQPLLTRCSLMLA